MTQFVTSATERGSFRDCRRRWFYEAVSRLHSRSGVAWPLLFGNAMHAALEEYYRSDRDMKKARKALANAFNVIEDELRRELGGLFQYMEVELQEHWELGVGMLTNYDIFDQRNTRSRVPNAFTWDEIVDIAVEERSFVEILNPVTGGAVDGRPLLSGKLDLVVRRKGKLWIVDHKTYQRKQSSRALDVDDQLTAYCYIAWKVYGEVPAGAVYNVLIKDLPTEPKRNKDGSLSQDKRQRVTHDTYLEALTEAGISDHSPYSEYLAQLKTRGWQEFFTREVVTRGVKELESFERRLYYEYEDMVDALDREEKRYPNPSQRTCGTCSVLPICRAHEEQGDVAHVIETQYYRGEPRYVIPDDKKEDGSGKVKRRAQEGTARKGSAGKARAGRGGSRTAPARRSRSTGGGR